MIPKVFYNDKCAVCNIEIDHYKKKCTTIEWVGIHQTHNIKKYINKTPKELMINISILESIKSLSFKIWEFKLNFLDKFSI